MEPSCAINIGTKERNKRKAIGALLTAGVIVLLAFLVASGANPMLRLTSFFLIWSALLCFLQARRKVCVVYAAKGMTSLDEGKETLADIDQVQQLKQIATSIYFQTTAAAVLITLLTLALP